MASNKPNTVGEICYCQLLVLHSYAQIGFRWFINIYHSLPKERPWAEHLTSLPKRGVGALSTVSAFNQEKSYSTKPS